MKNKQSFRLIDFIGDILKISRKYGMEEYFKSYIQDFINDMRHYGLIKNDREKE